MAETKLKILYGPPGTGKTWRAAREAVSLLQPGTDPEDVTKVHSQLVASGQIIWVTFHPSYTYEDFVEGFRPEATDKGILYTPRPGPFRIACANVTKSAPPGQVFYVGQEITSTTGKHYQVIAASNDSVVLKNMEGKGLGLETPVSMHVVQRLRDLGFNPGDLSIPGSKHAAKVEIADQVGIDMQTLFGMTGPLRAVWEYVEQVIPPVQERREVVLVIDEINRADLSRVFGELITLLEADKRLGEPEERRVMLAYSQTLFGVPKELHVIGTMNTADRSLSVMDSALRRRFEFEEVGPDASRCAHPYADVDLRAVLTAWNRSIRALASKDAEIGHAYFEVGALDRVRARYGFGNSPDEQLKAVALVLRRAILPLLLDGFRNDWTLVDLVLGEDYSAGSGGFINQTSSSGLVARAGDVVDFSDAGVPELCSWADPSSSEWDPSKFRSALMQAVT